MNLNIGDFLTVSGNQANFHGFVFTIPEGYTCYGHRDEPEHFSVGKGIRPIGALTVNVPVLMETTDQAQQAFGQWEQEVGGKAVKMILNGYDMWFSTDSGDWNETDRFLWPGVESEMCYSLYLLKMDELMILFSYRVPEIYEDDGRADEEHAAKMAIMESVTWHWKAAKIRSKG